MSHLPSRPRRTRLREVFAMFPEPSRHILALHEVAMRGPSELTPAERELIFAYGSGLNACAFCHESHKFTAEAFGVDPGLFQALFDDVERAPVSERLRPILRYVKKLTLTPSRIVAADVAAILAAGWGEKTVFDVALICGLHNMMNRIVDGLGVAATAEENRESARRLSTVGYAGTAAALPREA